MQTRRFLAGSAIALAAFASAAAPAAADDADYPLVRPEQKSAQQGATGPTEVAGVKSGVKSGVESGQSVSSQNSGLARTGADLAPLWGGLALVLVGGALVLGSRTRRDPTR